MHGTNERARVKLTYLVTNLTVNVLRHDHRAFSPGFKRVLIVCA